VESVKLLRAMKLDPVELRGVGIQITKLEGEAKAAERQPGQGMLPFGAKKESASVSADTERKETARQSHSLSSAELDIEPDTEVIHHPETLSADAGSRRSPEQNDAVDQIEPGSTTPILAEQGVQEEAPLEAIGVGPVIPEASALRISRSARSTSRGYLAEDSVIAGPSRLTTSSDGIDPDFLAALPAELRLEVKRDFARTRAASETPPPPPPNPDRGPRATTISPAKPKGMHAAAHITRQLRPKMKTQLKASAVADLPLYGAWAKAKEKDDAVDLTAENDSTIGKYLASELRELDIDPDVFAELPAEMQNEVVLEERRKHKQRKILHRPADRSRFRSRERQSTRSASLSPSRSSRAGSVPLQYAKPQPRITITRLPKPALLKAVSLPDVLETVTRWIESRGESGPAPRDAGKVRTYLMKCMGPGIGLGGVENVVEVLKWMRSVLLERWEEDDKENRQAGKEWWATWRGFKDEVDRISLRRFGAPIRL